LKPNSKKSSIFLAIGLVLLAALLWALSMPAIGSYRANLASRLVDQALSQQDDKQKLSLLQQAQMVDSSSQKATLALTDFWKSQGNLNKAVAALGTSSQPNYMLMGDLSLLAQNYPKALSYYSQASKNKPTAASLAGEAKALYNLEKTNEGCTRSAQAAKLSLLSQEAKDALAACTILGGVSQEATALDTLRPVLTARESAYFLIDTAVYKIGESRLLDTKVKTAYDWLLLSKLASARGDLSLAISRLQDGLTLDGSSKQLNSQAIELYRLLGDKSKQQDYQERLRQLQFTKYQ